MVNEIFVTGEVKDYGQGPTVYLGKRKSKWIPTGSLVKVVLIKAPGPEDVV